MAQRKKSSTAVEEQVAEPTVDTFIPRKYFVQISYNNVNPTHPEASYLTRVGTFTYYTATGTLDITQKSHVKGHFMDDLANRDIDIVNPDTKVKRWVSTEDRKEWVTSLWKAELPAPYVADEAQLLYIDE